MRRALVLIGLATSPGCPPGKPAVELPPASGSREAQIVGMFGGEDDLRDPRALVVAGGILYAADPGGLYLYDLADPSSPVLRSRPIERPLDDVAVSGERAYVLDIGGSHVLTELDIGDAGAPAVIREVRSKTLVFGGLAARGDLVWHAVGANPPSRLFRDLGAPPCDAPDRERGAMDVWLGDGVAFETIHFDDFAGDGLDGNGAYGLAAFVVEPRAGSCPRVTHGDTLFFDTHARNRSAFERGSASDLQVATSADGQTLFVTGEQQVRSVGVGVGARLTELDTLPIPDALAVAVDGAAADATVAVANGDLMLIDARDPSAMELAAVITTPGITRAAVFAGDGRHLFVSVEGEGIAILQYQVVTP